MSEPIPAAPTALSAILAGWRKITEAATPAPWNAEAKHGRDIADEAWSEVRIKAPDGSDVASTYISHLLENCRSEEDEAFIVTARTAMPVLLAAVERALKLAGEWGQDAAYLNARAERAADNGKLSGPATSAKLSGRAQAKNDNADELVTAIMAALTGKEGSEDG
jgi:hypothetical protein